MTELVHLARLRVLGKRHVPFTYGPTNKTPKTTMPTEYTRRNNILTLINNFGINVPTRARANVLMAFREHAHLALLTVLGKTDSGLESMPIT